MCTFKTRDFNKIIKMKNEYRSKWWSSLEKRRSPEERNAMNPDAELWRGLQFRHRSCLTETLNPGQLTSYYIL